MTNKTSAKPTPKPEFIIIEGKKLTKGQLAYEQERAKQAGKSLEDWMKAKIKAEVAEAKQKSAKPAKKPGLISRLIDKAHKPI